MAEEAPLATEEAPSATKEGTLDNMATTPSFSEEKPDDIEAPLLPQVTQGVQTSKFYCHRYSSRTILIRVSILSVIFYLSGFIAAMVDGHVDVTSRDAVTMVFNILFTLVILHGAFKSDPTIVLVGLLWELFVVVFGITAAAWTFARMDWSLQPAGTQKGTEAFVVIAIIWQFLVIFAEVVFIYELRVAKAAAAETVPEVTAVATEVS